MAWGATFGAVGQSKYEAFAQTLSGYPFQSYSVFVVLGTHTASAVFGEVEEVETLQTATLVATRGTVSVSGPAGIRRADTEPYTPMGFDPVYAAWDAHLDANAASLTLSVPSGSLTHPVFHLHGYSLSALPTLVMFGGRPLAADVGYFGTVDAATKSVWLTLNLVASGSNALVVQP